MGRVQFLEAGHQYLSEEGELISVSKFTERFKEKQNWDEIARKSALKLTKGGTPTTKAQILQKWANKRDQSARIGTLFHSLMEQALIEEEAPVFYNRPCKKLFSSTEEGTKSSIPIHSLENDTVYPELMIYDLEHMICGQSDKVIIADNRINIWDWKGLSLDTEIPTPSGFTLMRDIKQGDEVIDGEGNSTIVQHVSEIHYNPCYKIIFDTNDELICDHEHKWIISKRLSKRKYEDSTLRTSDIFKLFQEKIPIRIQCSTLNLNEKELPIDPYVLGAWLGDGGQYNGRITNMNPKLWKEIEKRGYSLGKDISNGGSGKAEERTVYGLQEKLNKLGLIKNKHIPTIYLRSSYKQKLDLLRGFMDTDGHYHKNRSRCVMMTTRKWQANATMEIVSSLGWKPTLILAKASGFGKKNIPCFHVNFNPIEDNPFLTRNEDIILKKSEKSKFRYIKRIEIVDTVPTRCISVSSSTSTYLTTRSYIKTHNTDAEITFRGFSNEWTKARKLLPPLEHLDECNGNIYSIKMSLYMYLLWKANKGLFKPGDLIIEHVHLKRDPDNDNIPILENDAPVVLKKDTIILPYRKREVVQMLKTLKA